MPPLIVGSRSTVHHCQFFLTREPNTPINCRILVNHCFFIRSSSQGCVIVESIKGAWCRHCIVVEYLASLAAPSHCCRISPLSSLLLLIVNYRLLVDLSIVSSSATPLIVLSCSTGPSSLILTREPGAVVDCHIIINSLDGFDSCSL